MTGTDAVRLVERADDAVLFRTAAGPVTSARFVAHAQALAASLPQAGYVLNLCRDRYAFAVALAAAVLRGWPALLTGDRSEAALAALAARYPGWVMAVDAAEAAAGCVGVPGAPPEGLAAADNPDIPAERLAAIVHTSGSTGAPAAYPKLWGALAQRSRAAGVQFGLDPAHPAAIIGTVPPQHMYGFETTVLLPLHAPAESWCGPAFFPQDIRAALAATAGPRILVTTPLQMRGLLGAGVGLPALAAVISATAPLDEALARAAEAAWSAPVLEIFGATEVGSVASRRTIQGPGWRLYPGVAMRADEDETIVSGPYAPDIALADEVALEGAAVDGTAGFRLLGRRSDIVKLGGHRASLAGLNRALTSVDGVLDGVFVVPDDIDSRSNARLLAVAVAPDRTAAGILADLRAGIDPLFLPRRVVLVAALPRNEMGKLPRAALLGLLADLGELPVVRG